MHGSATPCHLDGLPYAAVLHCVEGFSEVDGCDPQRLVPLGASLSELLQREKAVCRGVARSKACLVSGLVVVWRLKSLYKMGIEQMGR